MLSEKLAERGVTFARLDLLLEKLDDEGGQIDVNFLNTYPGRYLHRAIHMMRIYIADDNVMPLIKWSYRLLGAIEILYEDDDTLGCSRISDGTMDEVLNIVNSIDHTLEHDQKTESNARWWSNKLPIQFEAGNGRHFSGNVNFLISKNHSLYAECPVPDGASDDYGYVTMLTALVEAYKNVGGDPGNIEPWYTTHDERNLNADAWADCEVYTEVEL